MYKNSESTPDWQLKVKALMKRLTVCTTVEEEVSVLKKILEVQKNIK
jgi:hypothetical protein